MGSTWVSEMRTVNFRVALLTVRGPLRSTNARGARQSKWTRSNQIPTHNTVWPRMWSVKALKIGLEAYVITRERAHGIIDNLARERCIEHQVGVRRWRAIGAKGRRPTCSKEWLEGKVPADVVRDGVGNPHILKPTGGDLIIIIWVTPTPETVTIGIRPDSCMVKVRGV
jgi:hypothetical protein